MWERALWLVYPSASVSKPPQSGFNHIISDRVISGGGRKMKAFWFSQLWFCYTYGSAYNADFLFSLSHKHSYDSAYYSNSDFVAGENQLTVRTCKFSMQCIWLFARKSKIVDGNSKLLINLGSGQNYFV